MKGNKLPAATSWIDPDDAPELTDAFFAEADEFRGACLVRRGRPPLAQPKVLLSVRYSADVVAFFRATGEGWQTRMNDVLRAYVQAHKS